MAIDFAAMKAEMMREAGLLDGKKAPKVPVASRYEQFGLAVRGCQIAEVDRWRDNPPPPGHGAGYSLQITTAVHGTLRARLVASIWFMKTLGAPRLVLLRGCGAGTPSEFYTYEGARTLPKIGTVLAPGRTLVAWMDLTNQTAAQAADLVLAVANSEEILHE